ncbi:MAG: hypothetical protein GY854_18120 [Deltaproteobacteria bacterium]|nr:hypothetical protein [Deltaproteobacteria bacterium]
MTDNICEHIEQVCISLARDVGDSLQWSWDDRFRAALAQFSVDDKDSIHELLARHFSAIWESSNIAEAPDRVRKLCADYGGLRPGQLLFSSAAEQDAILLGLWWPWGNGKTISIRILPIVIGLPESEIDELLERFKTRFGC